MLKTIVAGLLVVALPATALLAADNAANPHAPAPAGGEAAAGGSPTETAKSAKKGSLKNPYSDFAKVAEEGHKTYMAAGCNGCHGGTGAAGWARPSPTRCGFTARTTTLCSA